MTYIHPVYRFLFCHIMQRARVSTDLAIVIGICENHNIIKYHSLSATLTFCNIVISIPPQIKGLRQKIVQIFCVYV
jgi:hypothetical protein